MLAREVMSHPVVTVNSWTSVADAAQVLTIRGFTAVPVVDDDGRLIGIVSEADLLRHGIPSDPRRSPHRFIPGRGRPPATVAEVMSTTVESLTPGADLADAAQMMVDERIRCLPIVDGPDLVGVVTRRDLLRAALTRDDQVLTDDIVKRLASFGEPDRWSVTVQGGVADIEDYRDRATDRETARLLAVAVPGVVDVRVRHQTPDPS